MLTLSSGKIVCILFLYDCRRRLDEQALHVQTARQTWRRCGDATSKETQSATLADSISRCITWVRHPLVTTKCKYRKTTSSWDNNHYKPKCGLALHSQHTRVCNPCPSQHARLPSAQRTIGSARQRDPTSRQPDRNWLACSKQVHGQRNKQHDKLSNFRYTITATVN